MTEKVNEIKGKQDITELETLPETIEDIEKDPILKPLLEFHKQASMLMKEDKLEHEFLVKTKEDIQKDLDTGIYDNSHIVKKFRNLMKEYDRMILIYSRYTDLADDKILEMKKIVEKYYITKKSYKKQIDDINNQLVRINMEREQERKKYQQIKEAELYNQMEEPEEESEDFEDMFLEEENPEAKEEIPKKSVKKEEDGDDEESMDSYLKRKVPNR